MSWGPCSLPGLTLLGVSTAIWAETLEGRVLGPSAQPWRAQQAPEQVVWTHFLLLPGGRVAV